MILLDGVTRIFYDAFYNCTSLTSITIPDSVTSINDLAFAGCTSLKSIMIPDSVTSIDRWAFDGYDGIVYCNAPTAASAAVTNTYRGSFCLPNHPDFELRDVDGSISVKAYTGIGASTVIPDLLTTWDGSECSLQSVTMPTSLSSDCSFTLRAANVTIPQGVQQAGELHLYDVNTLVIPASVINLDQLVIESGSPVVYCEYDTAAELWALLNSYPIVYLNEKPWYEDCQLTFMGDASALNIDEPYTFAPSDFVLTPTPADIEMHYTLAA